MTHHYGKMQLFLLISVIISPIYDVFLCCIFLIWASFKELVKKNNSVYSNKIQSTFGYTYLPEMHSYRLECLFMKEIKNTFCRDVIYWLSQISHQEFFCNNTIFLLFQLWKQLSLRIAITIMWFTVYDVLDQL